MRSSTFQRKLIRAQNEGRRLVAPLMGFPGLNMTGCTIKLAQQNYGEHFRVGNTTPLVEKMAETGVDAISLDSREAGVDLAAVAERLPPDVAIVGNVNPTGNLLHGKTQDVEEEVSALLEQMRPYPNFVLSTGCDLPQETPLENIDAFMRAGRRYRQH